MRPRCSITFGGRCLTISRGRCRADEIYSVVGFVLNANGIVGENDEMNATTLPKVKMPNRDGFVPDARPDVKAKR